MASLKISFLTFKAYFSEPYKRTVSNWSCEEFWRVEPNLYTPYMYIYIYIYIYILILTDINNVTRVLNTIVEQISNCYGQTKLTQVSNY